MINLINESDPNVILWCPCIYFRLIKIIQKLGREKGKKNGYILWQDALELDIKVKVFVEYVKDTFVDMYTFVSLSGFNVAFKHLMSYRDGG